MKSEFATFGGGCFWGVEKYLQEIPGVIDAISGYAGGITLNPTYSDVCAGDTGHAEVVNVEFDSSTISFESLLKEFIDKYGSRIASNLSSSSQYRSVVFYRNIEQKEGVEKCLTNTDKKEGKRLQHKCCP